MIGIEYIAPQFALTLLRVVFARQNLEKIVTELNLSDFFGFWVL
jgi:hypothetical protein